jgi:ribulose-phosphate 3-epimerase
MTRASKIRIAPSLLAADFAHLAEEVAKVEKAGADWLHVDVMDGHFVPNITLGPFIVEAIKRVARVPLDVHLMVQEPAKFVKVFADAGADILTFHIEATDEPLELVELVASAGAKVGLSVSPDTQVEQDPADSGATIFSRTCKAVDKVLLMTVYPGFGGQAFLEPMLDKIASVRTLIGPDKELQIDGGVNFETLARAAARGANNIVAGTFIFSSGDVAGTISRLREIGEKNFNPYPGRRTS